MAEKHTFYLQPSDILDLELSGPASPSEAVVLAGNASHDAFAHLQVNGALRDTIHSNYSEGTPVAPAASDAMETPSAWPVSKVEPAESSPISTLAPVTEPVNIPETVPFQIGDPTEFIPGEEVRRNDESSGGTEVIDGTVIEAMKDMAVTPTRPSLGERIGGLAARLKLKAGILLTGGTGEPSRFTKFLERHPKATLATGAVAVAGMVLSAYFKTKGINLVDGTPHAVDLTPTGPSIGSGVPLHEATDAAGTGSGAIPHHSQEASAFSGQEYVPMDTLSPDDSRYASRETVGGSSNPEIDSHNQAAFGPEDDDAGNSKSLVPRAGAPEAEAITTEHLNGPGDTISHHAEQHLKAQGIPHPNWEQIRVETQRILNLNGMDWEDAQSMEIGAVFKV